MKKWLVLGSLAFLLVLIKPAPVQAACNPGDPNSCPSGQFCDIHTTTGVPTCVSSTVQTSSWQNIFGNIEAPQNVAAYSTGTAGLINLLSNILKLSVVAAGIFGLINLVTSGIQWAGAGGNPEMIKQASSRVWMSILGLVIVAGAFVLAGVIGLLFFGSATAIINPVIFGPATPATTP